MEQDLAKEDKIMSSYIGSVPGDFKDASRSEADLELEKLEREKEAKILEKTNERLRDLVPNDGIYEAMENFLLGDPENQVERLGETSEILEKADEAKGKSEDSDRPRSIRDAGQDRDLQAGSQTRSKKSGAGWNCYKSFRPSCKYAKGHSCEYRSSDSNRPGLLQDEGDRYGRNRRGNES